MTRSGVQGLSSRRSNAGDLDPSGNVVLVVSCSDGSPRYERRPMSQGYESTAPSVRYTPPNLQRQGQLRQRKSTTPTQSPTAIRPTDPTDLIILSDSITPARSLTPVNAAAETELIAKAEPVAGSQSQERKKPRFRVSSRRLLLASMKFGKILFPGWGHDSEALTQPEIYSIDPDTLPSILNIIRFRKTRVPTLWI